MGLGTWQSLCGNPSCFLSLYSYILITLHFVKKTSKPSILPRMCRNTVCLFKFSAWQKSMEEGMWLFCNHGVMLKPYDGMANPRLKIRKKPETS